MSTLQAVPQGPWLPGGHMGTPMIGPIAAHHQQNIQVGLQQPNIVPQHHVQLPQQQVAMVDPMQGLLVHQPRAIGAQHQMGVPQHQVQIHGQQQSQIGGELSQAQLAHPPLAHSRMQPIYTGHQGTDPEKELLTQSDR